MQKITPEEHANVIERCLAAYLRGGTLDLSLDQLGAETGTTKRMLVHYFGNRQGIEDRAMTLFEGRLEAYFPLDMLASASSFREAVLLLWDRLTEADFAPSLRLTGQLFITAKGSDRALRFQNRVLQLWTNLLARHSEDSTKAQDAAALIRMLVWGYLFGSYDAKCRAMLERLATT